MKYFFCECYRAELAFNFSTLEIEIIFFFTNVCYKITRNKPENELSGNTAYKNKIEISLDEWYLTEDEI